MQKVKRQKILFIMQLPPPVHGVSVMSELIRKSKLLNEQFDCDYTNLATARKIENLQTNALYKYFLTVKILSALLFKLSTKRYNRVYITPFPFGFAFIKDSLVVLICRLFGHKPLLHLHTYGFKNGSERSAFWKKYYAYVFKNTEVICLSELLVEDIEFLHKGKVSILPNGIPQVNFKNDYLPCGSPVNLLYLSNLIKGKGILILVDALEIVKKNGHLFHLRIVGSEKDISYRMLRDLLKEKNLEREITLVGPKFDEEKLDEFRNAGIFILPSDYDTFGLVLLEAMQFGVPCISTHVGGIPDVLGEGRGLIIPGINAPELAAAIAHLIEHPDERKKMSALSFEYFESNYTFTVFEKGIINILRTNLL